MSMNLCIFGKRKIHIIKTGKIEEQIKTIEVWQTPTEVTEKILSDFHPLYSYFEWAKETYPDLAKDHISEIKEEIKNLKKEGYKIFLEMT